MVRVVITYPRGAAGATERAAALSAELEQAGLSAGAPFPLSRPVTASSLSYFFREDRAAALRVQELAGERLSQAVPRLGTVEGALPRPGAIEVELSATDTSTGSPSPAPKRLRRQAPKPPNSPSPRMAPRCRWRRRSGAWCCPGARRRRRSRAAASSRSCRSAAIPTAAPSSPPMPRRPSSRPCASAALASMPGAS
ncbi:hypothetical protein ACFQU7_26495 [Pseudoroseomonas wenyumeiae]